MAGRGSLRRKRYESDMRRSRSAAAQGCGSIFNEAMIVRNERSAAPKRRWMSRQAIPVILGVALAAGLLAPATDAAAQEGPPKNALFVESYGVGIYSLVGIPSGNYERRVTRHVALRTGISPLYVPLMVNVIAGSGSHHIEAGGGILVAPPLPPRWGVRGVGTLGYRHQAAEGGLLFRVGVMGTRGPHAFEIRPTASIGFAF
jgi:hypothetical protein